MRGGTQTAAQRRITYSTLYASGYVEKHRYPTIDSKHESPFDNTLLGMVEGSLVYCSKTMVSGRVRTVNAL